MYGIHGDILITHDYLFENKKETWSSYENAAEEWAPLYGSIIYKYSANILYHKYKQKEVALTYIVYARVTTQH